MPILSAILIGIVFTLMTDLAIAEDSVRIVAVAEVRTEEVEWSEFHADAMAEYADEFTMLFNSYETKRAKNGRIMIRTGNTGSFKFARKG